MKKREIEIKKQLRVEAKNDFSNDFPILKKIIYLDNAATTQKPKRVIDRIKKFYEEENANTHSGVYHLSENATRLLDESRIIFADLMNAKPEEIIFTKNTTDSMNILADSLSKKISKGDNIITTEIEHHSNFVPWQQLAKNKDAQFKVAEYNVLNESINPENLVDKKTKIVTFTLISNVSGLIIPAEKIIKEIRKKNKDTIIILDVAQAIMHMKIDVKKLDADFVCFSAHKLYGPLGVGIIYGKHELLQKLQPTRFGGSMINSVSKDHSVWADLPQRLEAGTINIDSIVGASEAIKYLQEKNTNILFKLEEDLKNYALSELKKIKEIQLIGHKKSKYSSIISFTIQGIHPHDVASICARNNVCIRAGNHCAQPFHKRLNLTATNRISISFYNKKEDIDKLVNSLKESIKIIGKTK